MRRRITQAHLLVMALIANLYLSTPASYAAPPAAPVNLRLYSTPPLPDGQTTYIANLTPPSGVASAGSGSGVLSLNVQNGKVTIRVTLRFQGLTSKPTVAEIVDAGGSVLFDLAVPISGQSWDFEVKDPVLSRFSRALTSQLAIVVKTEQYPAAEIRGTFSQITGSVAPPPTPTPPPSVDLVHVTPEDASRFLRQATFGPNYADIQRVAKIGISAFLDEELSRQYEAAPCRGYLQRRSESDNITFINTIALTECFDVLTTGRDDRLLLQRMIFALSELFVINRAIGQLQNSAYDVGSYYDAISRNALGNFRNLLEEVTTQMAMGQMLNIHGSTKNAPNENYARELLQLFTIGLWKLHQNGTLALDASGLPQPTYEQSDIVELAKIFTGYEFHFWDPPAPGVMTEIPELHSNGPKTFLGTTIPAGLGIAGDRKAALDYIFNHPNVGPFISRFLIQRLVTSNPSPDYIYRVAQVFNNNGKGIRGDLGAVARAILTDYEARNPDLASRSYYGAFSEPYKYIYDIFRAFQFRMPNGRQSIDRDWLQSAWLGQAIMASPTVFNFFRPDFAPKGPIQQAGLVSPEFQIYESYSITTLWYAIDLLNNSPWTGATSNLNEWLDLYQSGKGLDALLSRMDLVFFAGRMPEWLKDNIRDFEKEMYLFREEPERRLPFIFMIAFATSEYRVQK